MKRTISPRRAFRQTALGFLLSLLPAAASAQPAPVGASFPVTGVQPSLSGFAIPAVATVDDGRSVVVWPDSSSYPDRIFVRVLDVSGRILAEVVLDDVAVDDLIKEVAVTPGPDDTFVVAWVPGDEEEEDSLKAQWMRLDGRAACSTSVSAWARTGAPWRPGTVTTGSR